MGNESREIVERNREFVEQARATANLHLPAVRALQENGSVQRMLESIATREEIFRQYADPLQELRSAGVFDLESGFHRELRQAEEMLSAYTSQFTLPDMGAVNAPGGDQARRPVPGELPGGGRVSAESDRGHALALARPARRDEIAPWSRRGAGDRRSSRPDAHPR